jgi:hypothetical protein
MCPGVAGSGIVVMVGVDVGVASSALVRGFGAIRPYQKLFAIGMTCLITRGEGGGKRNRP